MKTERRVKLGKVLIFVVLFTVLAFVSVGCTSETPPEEEWNKTFGENRDEWAYSVQQTVDGGYILAGKTTVTTPYTSPTSYTCTMLPPFNALLVKIDSHGAMQWNKTFSGWYVYARSVQQTADGGYILTGSVGLVKTNSDGNEQWHKTFSGHCANSVQQTADGGYILAGDKFWLMKTDLNGTEQWNKTFGGTLSEAKAVQQTADGGYILAGFTYSMHKPDFLLVKTDLNGAEQWSKTFGGTGRDWANSVQQTTDGGYILVGYTSSYGAGSWDFWLVKADSDGNELWNKTFGGTGYDEAYSVQQTADGGYILAGVTESYGTGGYEGWLLKTDLNGNEQWNKTFGGKNGDRAYSVQQTADGGYILAGYTSSYGAGRSDFWLIKVKGEKQQNQSSIQSHPKIRTQA